DWRTWRACCLFGQAANRNHIRPTHYRSDSPAAFNPEFSSCRRNEMVFSSSTVPELTQKHVRTLRQRCVSTIVCSACSPEIHEQVVRPFLQHLKEQTPSVTMASDPVTIAWAMFKQGALPCMIFKWLNRTAIEDVRLPSADNNWGFDLQNVRVF